MDLKCGWDFNRKSDREEAMRNIRKERPALVIGSPPCTMFSAVENENQGCETTTVKAGGLRRLDT